MSPSPDKEARSAHVEDAKSPSLDLDGPPPPTPPKSEDGNGETRVSQPSTPAPTEVAAGVPNGDASAVQDELGEDAANVDGA